MKGTVIAVLVSFGVMGVAYRHARAHMLHIGLMAVVMVFDVVFPVYLYVANDWPKRLIEKGEIFSFSIWMHVMLIIALYSLYVIQIQAGKRLLHAGKDARKEHRQQAIGILAARMLVFVTGALLIAQ